MDELFHPTTPASSLDERLRAPCYLQPGNEGGHMWQRADLVETTLLADGAEVLAHSRAALAKHHVPETELRGVARRLVESLASALLVAESRGRRL
ncbi:hypothetical protein NKH77_05510 [Streptomyces sp. M19]